jgi:hypothetical protein
VTYPLGEDTQRTIGLIWRRGSPRSAEFRRLGESITRHRKG